MKAEGYNPNDIEVIKIYIIFYFFFAFKPYIPKK